MNPADTASNSLSPWWRHAAILTLIFGFSILIFLTVRAYDHAPPIPESVNAPDGTVVITGDNIRAGQEVFLKYGLMENGTIWGHGGYLGPDYSAEYLHSLTQYTASRIAYNKFGRNPHVLNESERNTVFSETATILKGNRYDPDTEVLFWTEYEVESFTRQIGEWRTFFALPEANLGLPAEYISDTGELHDLTAFFAWTAWASAANRPGESHSYTNNFPYAPEIGNTATSDALLWSAISLIALLGGTALVLFIFGKFDYLGWKHDHDIEVPRLVPGYVTDAQKAVIKYFVIVAALFLLQSLFGGATAHYRAEPGHFFGIDLSSVLPSNIVRTWHIQLAIFWIAAAYVAGGLMLAATLGRTDPKHQKTGINILFGALVFVVLGSMVGEWLGTQNMLGDNWFLFGHQGWEYLDLGRIWQVLLAIGLVLWLILVFRALVPARSDTKQREISSLFLYSAVAIPLFYLPAFFIGSHSNFAVADTWRFWIIHLWVEGFFELFVTVMVATIFYKVGVVSQVTATRVVYLDAILYLIGGIAGTAHHWYWTGQTSAAMAIGAVFSALEVVPLTLLTLDAWDFIKLTKGKTDADGKPASIPHYWTFNFLIAVGFWNFVGAGVFGFLINMPIVSYYEVGTILTPNHGHAAMMGVFGMLALALLVFALRQVSADAVWGRIEKYIRLSFWGLNIGLGLMVITNLFPAGVLQLVDVLQNGYRHARSLEFLQQPVIQMIEWLRLPADMIFIFVGAVPLVFASMYVYRNMSKTA